MRVAISGGTGFIGKHLVRELLHAGHEVEVWTRSTDKAIKAFEFLQPEIMDKGKSAIVYREWPLTDGNLSVKVNAIINLAGETINQRWTKKAKQRILNSRIQTTSAIVEGIRNKMIQTDLLINASAIGIYGTSLTKKFTEKDICTPEDFLSEVTSQWEREAEKVNEFNVRLIKARFGVVLDRSEGAFPSMLLPYRLFAGGTVGSGEQWVSWIHVDDLTRLLLFALSEPTLHGALNCTAPQPVKMKQFGKTIGQVFKRPHWIPAPSFALKLMLGEMSDLILKGQYVYPQVAEEQGFNFRFRKVQDALTAIADQ